MRWLRELWSRLTHSAKSTAAERRVDEEMAFHLERSIEKLRAQGLSDRDARRQAALAFGRRESAREESRDQLRATGLEDAWRDIRLVCGHSIDRHLQEETTAHVEEATAEYVQQGMSQTAGRRAAPGRVARIRGLLRWRERQGPQMLNGYWPRLGVLTQDASSTADRLSRP